MHRRTKIVATVGPACESPEQLQELMVAGVDVFRLNFSHGDLNSKAMLIRRIRALSEQRQQAVAILADLQGPKIRTGLMEGGSQHLIKNQQVTITTRELIGKEGLIPARYPKLPDNVAIGERILLDDGMLELIVEKIEETEISCRVVHGGKLKDCKGINLPGASVSVPCLTEKDLADLAFCIKEEVDFLALSFVRHADDVKNLQERLHIAQANIPVIAKIEKPQAIDDFDNILQAADGIMVARGDLGVEIPPEQVPLLQKQIIRKCNQAGKPVITATQMLESMIDNPRPTRAETSDVANAIMDGTDAVMLSAETAAGKYPLEAVSLMVRVAVDVESDPLLRESTFQPSPATSGAEQQADAIGQAACHVAENVSAAAILAFTQTGSTAALVAKYRPSLPIYAVTPSLTVRRQLALHAGVQSISVANVQNTEEQIHAMEIAAIDAGVLKPEDVVVITMGSPVSAPGTTNLLKVHTLTGAENK
jgi:pyruvate kinase